MRFKGVAFVASVIVLGACGGGEKAPEKTPDATKVAPTTVAPVAGAAATGTAMPITGKTIEVKMISDAKGYRFEPANVTAKVGDGIKFVVEGGGGPHNVAFADTAVPRTRRRSSTRTSVPTRWGRCPVALRWLRATRSSSRSAA